MEFTSGTDPENPADVFLIAEFEVQSNGAHVVKIASKPAKVYQLQGAETFTEPKWVNVGDRVTAADDHVTVEVTESPFVIYRTVLIR